MSDLEVRPVHLPDSTGGRPSFLALAARVTSFSTAAFTLVEGLRLLRREMERDADEADRLAEMCDQAEVEPRFTSLIRDADVALRAVATTSGEAATVVDDMATAADDLNAAHDREYRGVYETVQSSGVQQARPGFYRTR
ncbi:conjugal transfer protein TraB [Streptomyces sp. NBC_01689]|uniref:conjugal transfer protein TraB n=1 Tax=Streptomyces sp. NBC_01689 TaxID=2975911 RepID=UPI002E36C1FF|nr:conjugal transfer protein TraB [Streptomyces sp. NBC_01689]